MKGVIFGAPGSGKGTYASRLHAKLGVEVIAMGDIFRELMKQETKMGKKVGSHVEKGSLVPDKIVTEVLKERLAGIGSGRGFILDGYPRTIEQAELLAKITDLDVVILLTVPDRIIIERLSTRRICRNCGNVYNIRYLKPKVENVCDKCGGPLYQRSDDTSEVIERRIDVYEAQTKPILKFFEKKSVPFVIASCTELDTPPETIVDEILEKLRARNLA